MAARRLIIVLVLLLVISSIAAQLAQPPSGEETTSGETSTTSTGAEQAEPAAGRLLRRKVAAGAAEPAEIRATAGDQLELLVSVREPGSVEIPGLGLLEAATPRSPARFNLLLRRTGRLRVVGPGGGTAALIIVGAAGSAS